MRMDFFKRRTEELGYLSPLAFLGSALILGMLTLPTIAPLVATLVVDTRPSVINSNCAVISPQDYARYVQAFGKQLGSVISDLGGTTISTQQVYWWSSDSGC
jgi:hypothetical protein